MWLSHQTADVGPKLICRKWTALVLADLIHGLEYAWRCTFLPLPCARQRGLEIVDRRSSKRHRTSANPPAKLDIMHICLLLDRPTDSMDFITHVQSFRPTCPSPTLPPSDHFLATGTFNSFGPNLSYPTSQATEWGFNLTRDFSCSPTLRSSWLSPSWLLLPLSLGLSKCTSENQVTCRLTF
jgi:hypothetical protein